jgi:hypothetical protein
VEHFTMLDHPVERDSSLDHLGMVSRGLSSQWLYLRYDLNTLGRSVALFDDTPYPTNLRPKIMTAGWQHRLLGSSVAEYCTAVLLMHSLAVEGKAYPFGMADMPLHRIFPEEDSAELFEKIVHKNMLTTIEAFHQPIPRLAEAAEQWNVPESQLEPWGYNLLQGRPFVGGVTTQSWIAPCAPIVLQKASAPSIAYAGLARFDCAFTDELGHLFQAYIGRQLALVRGAKAHPEISFRPSNQSVDWILITPHAVFLVECKSAFPNVDVKEGRSALAAAHEKVIGHGIDQINKTVAALRGGGPEFAVIPPNLPLVGLVVTLGDYDLGNNELLRSHMTQAQVPTAAVSSEFLERMAVHPSAVWDHLAKVATASAGSSNVFETRHLLESYPPTRRNPIIDAAFQSIPVVARAGDFVPGRD